MHRLQHPNFVHCEMLFEVRALLKALSVTIISKGAIHVLRHLTFTTM